MWVRGLKCAGVIGSLPPVAVAPHVGAWIEIVKQLNRRKGRFSSHPMWVRGLK